MERGDTRPLPLRLLLPLLCCCAALRPPAAAGVLGATTMGSRGGGAEDADLAPRYHLNNGAHFQNDPSAPIFLEVNGTLQWFVFPDQNKPDAQGLARVFTSHRRPPVGTWLRPGILKPAT